ncbi:MAG: class I SAM-dependent methyltransferase, partial [Spirochaetaceae bacterium]|nr:class I SAM-dependent methyltransferase [Spirochaetaceae bacterium]
EVCSGLGIPCLTYTRLTQARVRALDIDPKILSFAEDLRDRLGCDVEFECRDVFQDRPELREGEMLVAEKPASYKKNSLEVEYTIRNWCAIEGQGLALIPSFLTADTPITYSARCAKYEKRFKQVGFKVENEQVFGPLPYRWIIATK